METVSQPNPNGKEPADTFVRVPRSLLKDKGLKAYDFATYIAIASIKPDPAGYRTVKYDTIAKRSLLARSTVQKSVKRLLTSGHIAIDGAEECNRYFLTSPLYGK